MAAAVQAPTAVHEEPWAFVIVQDGARLDRLSRRAKQLLEEQAHSAHQDSGGHAPARFLDPDFSVFYNASTLIVICTEASGAFVTADCWLAAENLMLAAVAHGLGSCVIGSAVPALNQPEIKAELGIPAAMTAVAPIIVGVPAGTTLPVARKEPRILTWR